MIPAARRGPCFRLILALLPALAASGMSGVAYAADRASHCAAAAPAVQSASGEASRGGTHAGHAERAPHDGAHERPAAVIAPEACSHCTDNQPCPAAFGCAAGAAMALVPDRHAIAFVPADGLREGWLADRPLSRNPSPPTPPPPPIL